MRYETVIGLEVHAQLSTDSKIFCGCSTTFGAEPNTQTCPICLGMPGVLPVLNKKAVEYAIRMALAVHCEVNERSIFARKNYFYPDLPKGYQISQYEEPLAQKGWVEVNLEDGTRKYIRINRIHLEEDAGKSVHAEEYVSENESLIDFNRCGVPLIEIVSEPDIRSPEEARLYLTKVRQLVRWLSICDGNMEEGSLRCDANISLRPEGAEKLGVRTELKNMNSFRSVERALAFEVKRQTSILEKSGKVLQETLLWDKANNIALPMRGKEEAHDYRYFPEPDLVPLIVKKEWKDKIQKSLPEMPDERKLRWAKKIGIPEYDASVLTEEKSVADYFEAVVDHVKDAKQASNWVMGEALRILKEEKLDINELKIRPSQLADIIKLVEEGKISRRAGKAVFNKVAHTGATPEKVVEELGLVQLSDSSKLDEIITSVIEKHPVEVQKFLKGRKGLLGFFMGEVMKATNGKANPKVVNEILRKRLKDD